MQPLTPDDLLIRRSAIELEGGLAAEPTAQERKVLLERFQTLEHVIRDNPLTAAPYLELARIYFDARRWLDAKRVLENACHRFPEHEEASYLFEEAQLARSLQLYSEADKAYREAPTRITADSLEQSRIELNVLREKICRGRLARHPEQWELYLPLATALANLGQREDAIRSLKQIVAQPKLRSAAAIQLGQIYESANRVPEALNAYRRAALFRVPPPSAEIKQRALTAAANLAERCHLIDSARRYVGLLLEMDPDNAELKARHAQLFATPL